VTDIPGASLVRASRITQPPARPDRISANAQPCIAAFHCVARPVGQWATRHDFDPAI